MSKPRIKIEVVVDTIAHARTIRDAITTRLSGKDIFENHGVSAFVDEQGNVHATADVRFNGDVDRDDIVTWVKNQVQNAPQVKDWILSAKVQTHLCSHDDAEVVNCKTTDFVEWNRG